MKHRTCVMEHRACYGKHFFLSNRGCFFEADQAPKNHLVMKIASSTPFGWLSLGDYHPEGAQQVDHATEEGPTLRGDLTSKVGMPH